MNAFDHHLLGANFKAYIWKHATDQYLDICPINDGWKVNESCHLVPVPPAHDFVLDFTLCGCSGNCSSKRVSAEKEDLVCSDAW